MSEPIEQYVCRYRTKAEQKAVCGHSEDYMTIVHNVTLFPFVVCDVCMGNTVEFDYEFEWSNGLDD